MSFAVAAELDTDSANSTQLSLGAGAALKSSFRLEHYRHFAEKLQIYFPLTINLANLYLAKPCPVLWSAKPLADFSPMVTLCETSSACTA